MNRWKEIMGKGLAFTIIAFLLMVSVASADGGPTRLGINQEMLTEVIVNTDDLYLSTAVSTSTIIPGRHRILGFSCAYADTTETIESNVALYDCTAALMSDTTVFDEYEFTSSDMLPRWYPYPKNIVTQLQVRQGPGTTVVICYEDIRKF